MKAVLKALKAFSASADQFEAKVEKVTDGDTIVVERVDRVTAKEEAGAFAGFWG